MAKDIGTMKPKHPMMDWARLFDWPARFQVFSDRPDKEPHETRTYTAAHSTGSLESRSISPSSVQATPDRLHSASDFRLPVQCDEPLAF